MHIKNSYTKKNILCLFIQNISSVFILFEILIRESIYFVNFFFFETLKIVVVCCIGCVEMYLFI